MCRSFYIVFFFYFGGGDGGGGLFFLGDLVVTPWVISHENVVYKEKGKRRRRSLHDCVKLIQMQLFLIFVILTK